VNIAQAQIDDNAKSRAYPQEVVKVVTNFLRRTLPIAWNTFHHG
jgi:hypothetical protein